MSVNPIAFEIVLDLRRAAAIGCKLLFVVSLAGLSFSSTGCTVVGNIQKNLQYNDSISEWVIGQRNSAWAARAWHLRKHAFCNEKHLDDFCSGFRAGYLDVASGGNGCTPAFPPAEYWGWKYQSAEGQAQIAAWFAGYPHGARAAEEDGVGHFSQIQVSSASVNAYEQAGMMVSGGSSCQVPSGLAPASTLEPHGPAAGVGAMVPGESTPALMPQQWSVGSQQGINP